MKEQNNNGQMSLMAFGGLEVDQAINKVFGSTDVNNSKGRKVGTTVALRKKSELKELMGIDDPEQLEDAVLKLRDEAMRAVKSKIAGLPDSWTLHKLQERTVADGVKQVTLVIRDIKRAKVITAEQLAKAWNIPLEEAKELMAKYKVSSPVEVESTTVPHQAEQIGSTVPEEPKPEDKPAEAKPEETADEKKAREEAELERQIAELDAQHAEEQAAELAASK